MNRRFSVAILLIAIACIGLVAVGVSPAAADDGPSINESELVETIEVDHELPDAEPSTATVEADTFDADSNDESEQLVVELTAVTDERTTRLEEYGDVRDTHGDRVELEVDDDVAEPIAAIEWVVGVRPTSIATPGTESEGVETIKADEVHADGVTGDGVTVGVLDPTGFDVENDEIADNVVDARSFTEGTVHNGGDNDHGTATAEIVTDVAPDADLYLARMETEVGYANAVEWLVESDVDVIVMSAGFYAQPNDGSGFIASVADEAVEDDDVVWVNAAGNSRDEHYLGSFDDRGTKLHYFDGESNVNPLNNGFSVSAGQRIQATLTWDDWEYTNDHYNLLLLVYDGSNWAVVEESSTSHLSGTPTEQISLPAPVTGTYAVAVADVGAGGDHEIQLFASGGRPVYTTPASSVTSPAVGHSTMSVAAVNYYDSSLASYSSRGPTLDGRDGIDVAAPTSVSTTAYGSRGYAGTSAAAPHVGGLAALVRGADPSLDADETADRIRDGSNPNSVDFSRVDEPATDPRHDVGEGMIDASSTVESQGAAFEITDVISVGSIFEGDSFTVQVAVTNTGAKSDTQEIVASVDHATDSTYITLEPGETDQVTFTFADGLESGEHDLVVETDDDSTTIELTVGSEYPVDKPVYDAVAGVSGFDDTSVTGADLTQLRGALLDGNNVIDGVTVTGADYTRLRGYLLG
ncbi:S8 family serine peptidase [Natrialba swarupiae]|uniref:S8 family serine peptidase n=1 Tax=Natrialba swarupiae TaxID=2448032 RepID=A0A5D5AUT2_9EURY|nr:S8 family serine peptidase [Natrialba swarupiae]TYT62841.1 S8 family serine peptidase [Natrialba swarupiae]